MLLLVGINSHNYTLGELFIIRQGQILPTKKDFGKIGVYKYKVIYPSDINSFRRRIDFTQLDDYYCDKKIADDKILTQDDFIISCKGTIKGYSMYHAKSEISELEKMGYSGLITSNQCITFKPTASASFFYKSDYYLHNILEQIIPVMNKVSNTKGGGSTINYITINDISKICVKLPVLDKNSEIEEFNKIFDEWQEKNIQLQDAEFKLEAYNKSLRINIFCGD